MPHVIIKHFDAPVNVGKRRMMADAITRALVKGLGCPMQAVSIALQPVAPDDWHDAVFIPDIVRRTAELIQKPNYSAISVSLSTQHKKSGI